MKNIHFATSTSPYAFGIALAIVLATSAQAEEDGFFFKPYVGADYRYSYINLDDNRIAGKSYGYESLFADSLNGGDIHVGARIHEYLGFEASFSDSATASRSNLVGTTASSDIRLQAESLDALGYLPLGDSKCELIGLVGVEHDSGVDSVTRPNGTTTSGGPSGTRVEFGGGAQYWITDNLNVRALVNYQDANYAAINDVIVTSLGLNWQL
jgi:opacity protein-like surface antigen